MDSSLSADQKASLKGQLLDEVEEASAILKTLHATLWKAFKGTALRHTGLILQGGHCEPNS